MPIVYGDITTAMVKQYNANIAMLSQQKQSRLSPYVRKESQHSEYEFYDAVGPTEAQAKGARNSDTPLMETPHTRRRVHCAPYNWATLVDNTDKLRMITDPTNVYAVNANAAFNRSRDRILLAAALGVAYAGKEGEIEVPFPSEQVVGVQGSGSTDVGLTIDKLILAKEMFDKAEVDENEPRFLSVSAHQVSNLLRTTEVTSADYSTVKALVAGQVDTFMGFKFIRTELVKWASNVRHCVAWVPSGLLLASAEETTTRITERNDKNHAVQIYVEMDLGATRMEEVKVIDILCQEVIA